LKLHYDGPLANFAFNFNLRRYSEAHAGTSVELRSTRNELESASADLAAERDSSGHADTAAQTRLDEQAARLKMAAMDELENTKTRLEGERGAAEAGMRSTVGRCWLTPSNPPCKRLELSA